ncbi:MAG: PAS domain-containing protein [Spirochaetia bacterium]|nr:PAS domain-containing protein [Spirochaetota bacterium]MDW8112502.1 PAS domain-containing protein [Spirochaetia bacterium]
MVKTIKDVIHYLYRFKSPILIISNLDGFQGYVRTKDVVSLMNLGVEDVLSIYKELKLEPISNIFSENLNDNNVIPVILTYDNTIDLVSKKELKYITSDDPTLLEINFESILKNLPLPIIITDRFNRIVWLNLASTRELSLSYDDLVGKSILPFLDSGKASISIRNRNFRVIHSELIAVDVKVNIYMLI